MSDRIIATDAGAGPFPNGPEVEFALRDGFSSVYRYTGSEAECKAKRDEVLSRGPATMSVHPKGDGDWEIVATFQGTPDDQGGPQADVPTNVYELEVNVDNPSVYNSPRLNAQMTAESIAAVQRIVNKYNSGDYEPLASETTLTALAKARAALTTELDKIAAGAYTTIGLKLINAIIGRGVENVIQYNEVFRRTITAATYAQVKAAYVGTGKIWTDSEVTALEGIPTSEWFGLEANTQWIKAPPTVSAAWGGKTQIVYYYTGFKQASALFYEAYDSAVLLDV
jgi:hypothetical protein